MDMASKTNSFFPPEYHDIHPKKPESVSAVLTDYSGVTTAHGVPRIITSKSVLSKLFWACVTLVALAAFLWQGSLLLFDFRGHPYTTQIDVVTRTEVRFPAVTVCNMNKMRRSAMVGTRFESLIEADGGVGGGDMDYSWWFDWSSEWWLKYEESFSSSSSEESGPSDLGSDIFGTDQSGDMSGDSETDGTTSSVPETTFSEFPDISSENNQSSTSANQNQSSQSDVDTASETSDGFQPSIDEESSAPDEGPQVRKKRSGLRLIPDPITGKLDQRRRHIRRKRQTGIYPSSMGSSEEAEKYDWWESGWETNMFDYQEYDWDGVTNDNDWQGFYRQSTADDFSDLLDVINPTRQELEDMGHQAEDFILQCTFDRRPCNYTNFRQFQNKYYGNCFTFNQEVGNSSTVRSTGQTGAQYGLHLTLFTEQPEYVGLFAQEAGVRVAVHPPDVLPFPEDDGVVASTGQATNIGIRQSYFERLSDPHGNCTDGTQTNFTSEEYAYTTRACVKSCVQQHLFNKCGCVTDIMMNDTICSPRNKTEQVCRQAIEQFFHEGKLECICPIACEETLFVTAVTSDLWPSERYETHLKSRLTNDKAIRILQDIEQTRKNLARVRIYFEELNYEQMIQKPKYTFESLLGGIGGLLGLYIGFSVITICEVGVLVVDLIKYLFRKAYSHDRVVPINLKN
ncbi:amiloride-sensitive sodium channel subunit gamma-like [Lytechinus pictus]|uniref:amiloride-sensitive sodium channel subunit gamma-like n=1 Tax=Lytechinus pictus TaxID=7653 RepID=UPI0030BA042D